MGPLPRYQTRYWTVSALEPCVLGRPGGRVIRSARIRSTSKLSSPGNLHLVLGCAGRSAHVATGSTPLALLYEFEPRQPWHVAPGDPVPLDLTIRSDARQALAYAAVESKVYYDKAHLPQFLQLVVSIEHLEPSPPGDDP